METKKKDIIVGILSLFCIFLLVSVFYNFVNKVFHISGKGWEPIILQLITILGPFMAYGFLDEIIPKRIRRLHYSLLAPIIFAVSVTLLAISIDTKWFLLFCIGVVLFLTLIVMTSSRLHDINSTGWLALLLFVPIVDILLILILMFMPGSAGNNQYGSNPKLAGVPKPEAAPPNNPSDNHSA